MRIERQRAGLPSVLARDLDHTLHNSPVPDMQAVEIPDRNRTRAEIGRDLFKRMKNAQLAHSPALNQDLKTVIREPDVRRKQLLGTGVREIVADVSQKCAARLQLGNPFDRARQRGVSRMRLMAQRIQK